MDFPTLKRSDRSRSEPSRRLRIVHMAMKKTGPPRMDDEERGKREAEVARLLGEGANHAAIFPAARGLYRSRLEPLFEKEGRRDEFKEFLQKRENFRRAKDTGDPRGDPPPPPPAPPPPTKPEEATWDGKAKEAVLTVHGGWTLRTKDLAPQIPGKGSSSPVLATFPCGRVAKVIGIWWGLVQPTARHATDDAPVRPIGSKTLQALRAKRDAIESPASAEKNKKNRRMDLGPGAQPGNCDAGAEASGRRGSEGAVHFFSRQNAQTKHTCSKMPTGPTILLFKTLESLSLSVSRATPKPPAGPERPDPFLPRRRGCARRRRRMRRRQEHQRRPRRHREQKEKERERQRGKETKTQRD